MKKESNYDTLIELRGAEWVEGLKQLGKAHAASLKNQESNINTKKVKSCD